MKASDYILRKALVAADIPSKDWAKVHAGLRDRAFFMSRVMEQRILYASRQGVADVLDGKKDRSEVRRDLRKLISLEDRPDDERRGTIQDIFTKRRLDVMIDTNVRQAKGYAEHIRATSRGALMAFPAYELIRERQSKQPRDWDARWAKAANEVGWEGVARNGKKIALKTSPIWTKLSAFGNPFPPFDWGSGMGIEDVERSVCIKLGLVGDGIPEQEPPTLGFNGSLQAEVEFTSNETSEKWRSDFGDQLKIEKGTSILKWREEVFRENFDKGHFSLKLGVPQPTLIEKMKAARGLSDIADAIQDKQLLMTDSNWLDAKRGDGSNHRSHFGFEPEHPENIKLEKHDVELIPSIWRKPDQVRKLQKDIFELRIEALDGISDYVLQVKVGSTGHPRPWSFFRTTKKMPLS